MKTARPENVGQSDLFGSPVRAPEGFRYQANLIAADDEYTLIAHLESLPFQPFDFHGHLANRRVVGFSFRYDYDQRRVVEAPPIPDFLLPLRTKVAAFAGQPADAFAQVLINEYRPGAGIGWRRDKAHFADIAGVSLLAACDFRLRRKAEKGWDRETIRLERRSVYLLTGQVRAEWEHSIPPVANTGAPSPFEHCGSPARFRTAFSEPGIPLIPHYPSRYGSEGRTPPGVEVEASEHPHEPFAVPDNEEHLETMLSALLDEGLSPAVVGFFRRKFLAGQLTPAMIEEQRRLAS